MLISDKHKFVFIHNPKAAGISIWETLRPFGNLMCRHRFRQFNYYTNKLFGNVPFLCNYPMHISAQELRREIGPEKWDRYHTFGVVRNPYDRAASFFFYLLERPGNDKYDLFRSLGSFRNYILHLREQNFQETQKYYFTDESGRMLVNTLLRFENLKDEWRNMMRTLELPDLDLPFVNTRRERKPFIEYLDNEILEVMNDIFHDDFELFGYEKVLKV